MKTLSKTITAGYIGLLLAAGCAGKSTQPIPLDKKLSQRGYVVDTPVRKILEYRINGWNSIDRLHLIITSGVSDHYLVTLRNPCDELSSAETIAFSTTVGNLTDMDKLLVRGHGNFLQRCYIKTIHTLSKIKKPAGA